MPRIDVGIAASVMVGKQLLSASSTRGSSSTAVAAQEKRWMFYGYEVSLGDQVKWVNSSATSNDHCNWQAEEVEVDASNGTSSTAANITFAESSEVTGPLQLCYRFSSGDNPFKLYPAITVNVYELYSVAAEEGSASLSVVGYPKTLALSGFGIAESDEGKWLLQGATNCGSADSVASLAPDFDGENATAKVSTSLHVSFEFTEDVFVAGGVGNESANATLCYKFRSEEFQRYPAISMGIHHVTGWTSSSGGTFVAVVGVPEDLTFTGYGLSEATDSGDRAGWIVSGSNCSKNIAPITETVDGRVDVSDGHGSFAFTASASGESPSLCYWFQGEPAMLYASLAIDVAYVSALFAPTFGDADVAVVGYPKAWGFEGGHIQNGDYVQWIYNESSDCSDSSSVVEMEEDGEIISGETMSTFDTTASGRWITPCYRYGLELMMAGVSFATTMVDGDSASSSR